jgi:hypothetical protein
MKKTINLRDCEVGQLCWYVTFMSTSAGDGTTGPRPLIVLSKPHQKDHSILVSVLTDRGPEEFFSWMTVFRDE